MLFKLSITTAIKLHGNIIVALTKLTNGKLFVWKREVFCEKNNYECKK